MEATDVAAKRGRWRNYFERTIGGSAELLDAAADAAMYTMFNRGTREEAVEAGRVAAGRLASQSGAPTRRANDATLRTWPPNSAVVQGLERRTESLDGQFFQVWSFRLLRLINGTPTEPLIPVEMRGRAIVGQLVKGDVVEIPPGRSGHTRIVKSIRNLTTNSFIEAKGRPFRRTRTVARTSRLVLRLVGALLAILFLLVIVLIAVFIFNGDGSVSWF